METITTCDLYEGSYYLLNDCEIEAIEGLRIDGEVTCRLTIIGAELPRLQRHLPSDEGTAV